MSIKKENLNIILTEQKNLDFRKWLNLNLEGLTWQGRFEKEFESFWTFFFKEGLTIQEMIDRLNYAEEYAKIGPLSSWFRWLREMFLAHIFITEKISVYGLGLATQIELPQIASILRDFFIDKFPQYEHFFSNIFQIGNMASKNLGVDYELLSNKLNLPNYFFGPNEDDVMLSMEITLYEIWDSFSEQMRKDFSNEKFSLMRVESRKNISKQFKVLYDFILISIIAIFLLWGVKELNIYYEKYLADKISIYEPQFLWLDKTLKFKEETDSTLDIADVEFKDIEEEIAEDEKLLEFEEEERVGVESEVVLTSWDALPKDFATADLEQSDFEEEQKGGYRDTRFGNKKVYRVMMKSVDTYKSKIALNKILKQYNAEAVGKVQPGKQVPGGIYYNLFVPRSNLKEFLSRAMDVEDSILYESRTRGQNPPGMTKVFIWIKSI
ncbi:MAG: hypothetical protein H6622_02150 [Halobacteriovoraceae bacterium]|nr:hypothetical protein [Halobacteriovoraceae bacterium]